MRILVVEDEKKTASFVRNALQEEGHALDMLHDGSEALAAVAGTPFDVVVLGVMLPGRDGLSVVRQMRERRITTPVLLLTARGQVSEKVEGLKAGVRALGRRSSDAKSVTLRVGNLTLDTVTRQVMRGCSRRSGASATC